MAKSFTFKANKAGYREFMNSGGVQDEIKTYADRAASIADAALSPDWGEPPHDEPFTVKPVTGRVFGADGYRVAAHTEHAKRSENRSKTLTKAFHAIGG